MLSDLPSSEIYSDILSGVTVIGRDNAIIGAVRSVDGVGDHARINVLIGGFLGLGGQEATLIVDDLDFMQSDSGQIIAHSGRTKAELKAQLAQNTPFWFFDFSYGQHNQQLRY